MSTSQRTTSLVIGSLKVLSKAAMVSPRPDIVMNHSPLSVASVDSSWIITMSSQAVGIPVLELDSASVEPLLESGEVVTSVEVSVDEPVVTGSVVTASVIGSVVTGSLVVVADETVVEVGPTLIEPMLVLES